MASTIYLIRHAESLHNTTKNFSLRDPSLTDLGTAQSAALGTSFPALATTAVILASPLTRTIETTLAAFGSLVNNTTRNKAVALFLTPDLQERSALPCDTGTPLPALVARFPQLEEAIREGIPEEGDWFVKEGEYAEDDEAVRKRAGRVRERLARLARALEAEGGERRDVVVVTHGVFMKFLAEDEEIDLPKAGWKAYTVEEGGEGLELVPV
ncbi:histidine phosphatase superfamily [Podospora conica]|nr:histidine phosphatase superfamily [Schizothecium conicum]